MIEFHHLRPRSGRNRYLVAPPLLIHGEPDRYSPLYAVAAPVVASALHGIIAAEPRTKLVDSTRDGTKMQFIQRSAVFRLPDTIDIDVLARDADHCGVAIYSRSKYGRRDFGVNRRRVERWLAALERHLGSDKVVQPADVARPPSA